MVAHQTLVFMGFPRQEYWNRLPFSYLKDLPNPGIKLVSLVWQVDSLLLSHQVQLSSDQWLSHVWLFATPWTVAHQASLSIINSQSWLKLMPIESVMSSSHLILCHPLLLLPSIFPSIRVFSNKSTLCMRWPKYWSFSLSISPSNEHPRLISFRMDWLYLLAVQGILKSLLQTTVQKHQFISVQLSSQSNSHLHTWPLEKP